MLSIYRLPHQLPGEKIIKIVRKDVFIILQKIFLLLILVILPLAFSYFFFLQTNAWHSNPIVYPLLVLAGSAYFLFIWLFFFFSFVDYYLDVWIVTNQRIIDIEQRGFFSRVIAEHKLFRIQDVASEIHGLWPTMLNFGDVHVQTAGAKQRFAFKNVPDPNGIRDMVIKLVERKKREMQADLQLQENEDYQETGRPGSVEG